MPISGIEDEHHEWASGRLIRTYRVDIPTAVTYLVKIPNQRKGRRSGRVAFGPTSNQEQAAQPNQQDQNEGADREIIARHVSQSQATLLYNELC